MYKLKDWPLFYILPNRLGERCESSQGSWSSQRRNEKRKDNHAPVFVYIRATAGKIIHITRVVLAFNRRSVTHAKNKSTVPHVAVLEIKTYRVSKWGPFRTSDRVINSDKFSVITNILHAGVTRHVLHVSAWCFTTSGANGVWRLWDSQTKQKFVLLFCRDNSSFVC